ncbi:hypothetical protein AMS59_11130 [Lysinibacillus sp. FJAT-14745]|uniref:DUF4303 domain-containing protein n=1 Tax=Lysinibacillus sp. FJAT-14745 TaxID=1704289 RepID=UPI0006ABE44E|nr:DUF4303 domain-containing protein [Lysinibacillus sp. FJAT-14745]KOP78415.1 hypothetical protein AMS59_11130 [Lysinibacillus sp. FJAT-14745]
MYNDLAKLVDEIAIAAEKSFLSLFQNQESYYYCALVTTGEAVAPVISAWSLEALENISKKYSKEDAQLIKWSYADSPYWNFGCENFETVRKLFNERVLDYTDEFKWYKEVEFRLEAMVLAMEKIDKKGVFSLNQPRSKVYVNVEVMPPDVTNTIRALRLNKKEDILGWLSEAAEE